MIKTRATIVERIQSTPDTVLLRVAFPELKDFSFTPGQFCMLASEQFLKEDGTPLKRAYSLSSRPGGDHVEFCIKGTGTGGFSDFCSNLKKGDTLLLEGPYGRFKLAPPEGHTKHIALIASGSGIAPLMSMLRLLCRTGHAKRTTLIYGVKTMQDCIYASELKLYADDGVTMHICLSKEHPLQEKRPATLRVHHERLTKHIPSLIATPKDTTAYLCGSPEMVKETVQTLESIGMDPEHIHREMW